jgi:serine/threonine protein phosphatase PrpC
LEATASNAAGKSNATVGGATTNAALRCPGCGAGPGAIDEDGFCTSCGTQRRAPARDHFEVIVSPRCAGVSDIGKRHHQNEDYITLALGKDGAHVLVLCDGVSQSQNPKEGSKAGSDAACASVVEQLAAGASDSQAVVREAIVAAQAAICKVPFSPGLRDNRDREIDPAQSTIVLALVQDKKIHLGWAGDSRAYWVGKGGVVQITKDDSWADEQVAAGRMTMEEAMKRPEAHAITNSLGALGDGRNPGIAPTVVTMNVTEAGRMIICTDGFWNYAEDPKVIARLVAAHPANNDALALARALVNFARDTESGGKDNISVIVREF